MAKEEDRFMEGWVARGEGAKGEEKCGNCVHVDNDLGFFSNRCDLLPTEDDLNKVRSWNPCRFKPSRFETKEKTSGKVSK